MCLTERDPFWGSLLSFCAYGPQQSEEYLGAQSDVPSFEFNCSSGTAAFVEGASVLLKHHGASEVVVESFDRQIRNYLDTSSELVWLTRIKYLVTFPLAKYLRNPLPKAPLLPFRPSGSFRGWMKARLIAFNKKNTHLWCSFLQLKRCTDPLSDQYKLRAFDEHLRTLRQPDPGRSDMIEGIMENRFFKRILREIRDDLPHTLGDEDYYTPSRGACWEVSRCSGGQIRAFATIYKKHSMWKSCTFAADDFLVTMRELPVLGDSFWERHVVEIRTPLPFEEFMDNASFVLDNLPLRCQISAVMEPCKVRVISKGPAREYYSCKVLQKALWKLLVRYPCFRLIGRPVSPTDLLDLVINTDPFSIPNAEWISIDYKAATDNLSMVLSSRIYGEVVDRLPVEQIFLGRKVLGAHSLYYGDVRSGNKCLTWDSELLNTSRPLGSIMDPSYRAEDTPDNISYFGRMTRGQLMGSILSFIFLCLANLGVWFYVMDSLLFQYTFEQVLKMVLINGDDEAYIGNRSILTRHEEVGKGVGLELSVGKTYYHPTYVNINSTSFHVPIRPNWIDVCRRGICSDVSLIEWLPVNLIFGKHKVQGTDEGEGSDSLIDRYSEESFPDYKLSSSSALLSYTKCSSKGDYLGGLLGWLRNRGLDEVGLAGASSMFNLVVGGALPGKALEVAKLFFKLNKESLQTESVALVANGGAYVPFFRNYFLPVHLGGLGFVCPEGFKFFVTGLQRRVARSCLRGLVLESRPCQFREIPSLERDFADFRDPIVRFPNFSIEGCRKLPGIKNLGLTVLRRDGRFIPIRDADKLCHILDWLGDSESLPLPSDLSAFWGDWFRKNWKC